MGKAIFQTEIIELGEQVDAFLQNVINPILEENKELLGIKAEINV